MDGPQKAIVAAVVGAVVGFLSTLSGALSETAGLAELADQVWINAILAAILGSGLGGGATYAVPNKKKAAA